MRPSLAISAINPSTVVPSFLVSRIRSKEVSTGCPLFWCNQSRLSASVVYPVLIFFVLGSLSSSKRTTCNCFGEATLNSCPTASWAAFVSRVTSPSKNAAKFSSSFLFTAIPMDSIRASRAATGSSMVVNNSHRFRSFNSRVNGCFNPNIARADESSSCSGELWLIAEPSPQRSWISLSSCVRTPGFTK